MCAQFVSFNLLVRVMILLKCHKMLIAVLCTRINESSKTDNKWMNLS